MTVTSPNECSAFGTAGGFASVLIWSLTAPVMATAVGVDPFLYVALGDGVGALAFVAMWIIRRHNPLPELRRVPVWFYLLGFVGIGLHNLTWVAALQQAPPLEATLIIYTWPLLVVVFTTISLQRKLRWYHMVAGSLGLAGVAALMMGRGLELGSPSFTSGHLWAVLSSLTWSIFSAVAARHSYLSNNFLGGVFALSALFNGVIWLVVLGAPPAPASSLWIVGISSIFFALSYAMWDFGMKHGNAQLIGVLSFLTPVLSAVYLVLLGKAEMTVYLLAALVLVVTGIGIAKFGEQITSR
ncbi:MAG: DMT family transporter [Candidatus Devosia phytovorans]|uniref:DMT family transporter n=1 Tax=Candidatus Devosia phytovorans TaxID=3121372 RepID=A0AAJ5VTE9_9HYPH|nr:DMT family transporter [Devosia sp.]WEK04498.1 MAG: DMT family transporter [Devosia sp.]